MDKRLTDREVYPACWIVLIFAAAGYFLWKYVLGEPTIASCLIWNKWHVYCPGCGGTRAAIALSQGHPLQSLYYHPAVAVTVLTGTVYMGSQTLWRLRERRGWTLHYDPRWPGMLVGLFLANCALRNLLWLGFGIPI